MEDAKPRNKHPAMTSWGSDHPHLQGQPDHFDRPSQSDPPNAQPAASDPFEWQRRSYKVEVIHPDSFVALQRQGAKSKSKHGETSSGSTSTT